MLALGLDVVFSEVCIPPSYMRAKSCTLGTCSLARPMNGGEAAYIVPRQTCGP